MHPVRSFHYSLPLLWYSQNVFDLNKRKRKCVPSLMNSVPDSFFLLFSLPHWSLYRFTHSFDVHLRDRLHHRHQLSNVQMNRFIFYPFSLLNSFDCLTAPISVWRFYFIFISIYYFFSADPCVFWSFRSRNKNHKWANKTEKKKINETVDTPDRDLTAQLLRTNCSGKSKRFGAIPCWRHSCWCGGAVVVAQRWLKMWARRRIQHTLTTAKRNWRAEEWQREKWTTVFTLIHWHIAIFETSHSLRMRSWMPWDESMTNYCAKASRDDRCVGLILNFIRRFFEKKNQFLLNFYQTGRARSQQWMFNPSVYQRNSSRAPVIMRDPQWPTQIRVIALYRSDTHTPKHCHRETPVTVFSSYFGCLFCAREANVCVWSWTKMANSYTGTIRRDIYEYNRLRIEKNHPNALQCMRETIHAGEAIGSINVSMCRL